MKFGRHAHLVIAGSLIASPAAAADPRNISHITSDHRSGMGPYVGLSITIRSDEGKNAAPRLGLAAGLGYDPLRGQATAGGGHAPLIELHQRAFALFPDCHGEAGCRVRFEISRGAARGYDRGQAGRHGRGGI